MIWVLSWNLFHGRSVPAAGRSLLDEFSTRLAGWEWDVALLQEVPPWWPNRLAADAMAEHRTALTSRNAARTLRRALAQRWPDAVKSNGGGANVVLSRTGFTDYRVLRLRRWPERRIAQLVGLGNGLSIANVHASTRPALAREELSRLFQAAGDWSGQRPLVLGGDLNLRDPQIPMRLAARGTVDFIFVRGLHPEGDAVSPSRKLRAGARELDLSDHGALLVGLTPDRALSPSSHQRHPAN
jgi:endonuclease/exonuclease/phosphatase family metal-dependent hydrolase